MRVLDLFSGIGGFSLGLERAGMTTVAFCEIDPYCRAVLKKHWPEVKQYDGIRTLTADRLAADGIRVDAICGGFPCQDISCAGKKRGISGARSGLWSEYARVISEVRPSYVIVENSADLLARGAGDVLKDLAEIGYDSEWHCISASMLGAPHQRDRFWLVAYPNEDGESACSINDEARRMQDVSQDVHPDPKRGERPLGWLLAGIRREWEPVAKNGTWHNEDSPVGMGVDDGIPKRLDRLRMMGNSVLPQIPEIIGRAIMSLERT